MASDYNPYGKAKKGESKSAASERKKKYYSFQREHAEETGDQATVDKIYGKLGKKSHSVDANKVDKMALATLPFGAAGIGRAMMGRGAQAGTSLALRAASGGGKMATQGARRVAGGAKAMPGAASAKPSARVVDSGPTKPNPRVSESAGKSKTASTRKKASGMRKKASQAQQRGQAMKKPKAPSQKKKAKR